MPSRAKSERLKIAQDCLEQPRFIRFVQDTTIHGTWDGFGTALWVIEVPGPLPRRVRTSPTHVRQFGRMELTHDLTLDDERLRALCRAHGVRRLGLCGSALRGELRPDSDLDLLVEFEPGRSPGLLGVAGLELELEKLLGRKVDLRTPADLSPYFRVGVTSHARVLYDAA